MENKTEKVNLVCPYCGNEIEYFKRPAIKCDTCGNVFTVCEYCPLNANDGEHCTYCEDTDMCSMESKLLGGNKNGNK